MAFVYDVDLSIHIKDDNNNALCEGVAMTICNATYESFSSLLKEALHQEEMSRRRLARRLDEEAHAD